ncbi:DNA cytosine methyltransferase [Sinorhizobium meliloti]|nr:DNA cytosine methyltransferase [Sinorhizobium meliloti]
MRRRDGGVNVALRPEHLNIISLCTGGGGLDLGVELAIQGARSVCMVEREAFAVSSLVSAMEQGLLHPAPVWSDARTFDGRAWRGAVDGLIGGIPCQPHSLAGKKRGQHDERDLWSDARRIIVQSGAWFVLIENVAGMLAAGDDEIAGAQRVFRDLSKLGFEVEGGLFTAAEVGASHQRERIFIVGVLDDTSGGRKRRNRGGVPSSTNADGSGRADGRQRYVEHPGEGVSGVGLADAVREGLEGSNGREVREQQPTLERSGEDLGHADILELRRQPSTREQPLLQHQHGACGEYLFPPRPDDLDGWRSALEAAPELEPAFRRVADGLASRLDIARVDRLRMLGNGVVPLQAAYAIRTLVTRLAARGSAGAARLVRMMEMAAP